MVTKKRNIYVPYDLGVLLKSKGFNLDCIYHYKVSSDGLRHTNIATFEMKHCFGYNHNVYPGRVSAPLWIDVCDWVYKITNGNILIEYSPALSDEEIINLFTKNIEKINI